MILSLVGVAYANPYVSVEYESSENRNTKTDSLGTGIVVGTKLNTGLQVSGKFSYSQPKIGDGTITNAFEGRVKQKLGIAYVGARLGERINSNSNFTYYAIDTGFVLPVNNIDFDLSYRYRNSFENGNNFETNRYGIEGKYKITKFDSIGLRYSQSYGDSETNAWRLQYTHSF